jgi:hypothetical protein
MLVRSQLRQNKVSKTTLQKNVVAQIYNPSFEGGGDRRIIV